MPPQSISSRPLQSDQGHSTRRLRWQLAAVLQLEVTAILTFRQNTRGAIVSRTQAPEILEKYQRGNAMGLKSRPVFLALFALLAWAGNTAAQTFPTRPITVIVPFPAGGPTDTIARIMG